MQSNIDCISLIHIPSTSSLIKSSGAHPASYPMGNGGSFPGGKAARRVMLTNDLHLAPRSKNEWSYTSAPLIRLHGVVLS
jgi:hypothetical protein